VLADLRKKWMENGPAVALLEGFSGCGKSILAAELSEGSKIPTARVDAFDDDAGLPSRAAWRA
jgi:adenylylsulfate kinase-like enzyme